MEGSEEQIKKPRVGKEASVPDLFPEGDKLNSVGCSEERAEPYDRNAETPQLPEGEQPQC